MYVHVLGCSLHQYKPSACVSKEQCDLENTSIHDKYVHQHISKAGTMLMSARSILFFFSGVWTSFKSLLLLYVSVYRYLNQCTDVDL